MFPIIFYSPAEAVRQIYEMKQSNPSAIIRVEAHSEKDENILGDVIISREDEFFVRSMYEERENIYPIQIGQFETVWGDKNRLISSITITSIQRVEPKLNVGDEVYALSTGKKGAIQLMYKGHCSITTDTGILDSYELRDLIKLPSNIQTDA